MPGRFRRHSLRNLHRPVGTGLSSYNPGSLQHFRGSTTVDQQSASPTALFKKTIWDLAVGNGPGRRCYPHSGLFLFADHLSHPRRDGPSERFQGETLGLSHGPSGGSKGQKWSSLRFPFLTLACGATPRAQFDLHIKWEWRSCRIEMFQSSSSSSPPLGVLAA